ncbi:glycosyl transferase family protein [Neobacillus bataviensis LMG 21833]|uniref:Glycosyl transferase family protein n=1 Tax=Neobacillus bataviensis LMG 21833 TaxID=1117379 RepID=K6DMI6_9BACI|nr:glycosyltransferase family 2 protein [Neobacillus bataviensis]EKN69393.1 glycosyl transferase family protein [Neobacillus bataviensis LMG 21833]
MIPKISIIVPVYNVELYIHKCVDSILAQTLKEFELILVDDGSTDNCGRICDEYAKKDSRVIVIHKKNEGQASARNMGLEIIKGEFIGFVDSDDYIEKDMFEFLYKNALKYEAEVVECSINIINGKDILGIQNHGEIEIGNNEFALKQLLDNGYRNSMCNKLYKKEIFSELRFPNKLYEDGFVAYKIYYRLKKYVFIGEGKYNYVKRIGSTMYLQEKFSLKNLDGLESQEERYYFLKDRISDSHLLISLECHFFNSILYSYRMLQKNKELDPNKKYRNILKSKITDNYQGFLSNPKLNKYYQLVKLSKLDISIFNIMVIGYLKVLDHLLRIYGLYIKANNKIKAV